MYYLPYVLNHVVKGGCLDSSAQTLASSFMALGQKDISKFLYGPLTVYSVHTLRHLKSFFEIQFKVDEWKRLRIADDTKEEEDELRLGSEQKAMVTAMGIVMAFGLPMSDEVWSFFVDEVNGISKTPTSPMLSDWEYKWLTQVDALPREELDLSDPFRPAVQFKLRCDEYWIAMSPGNDFPNKPPVVRCAYQQGFSFEWYSVEDLDEEPSTLADLVHLYREYCEVLDLAISQIKLLENDLTTLIGYSLHEDDNQCFAVKLRLK
ncbi:hypothetical protein OESDEN_21585, partial [Oesophagostomum dentatum]